MHFTRIALNVKEEKRAFAGVPEYIENLLTITRRLHARVFRAQENLKTIMDRLYTWAMMPILYRKDARDENLLAIAEKDEKFEERYGEIEATAEELERILKENYKLFFDLLPDSAYDVDESELFEGSLTFPWNILANVFDICLTKYL